MYASKENARKAREELLSMKPILEDLLQVAFIENFLTAAERKLPTEASYRRAEKPRKRTKLANG